LQVNSDIIRGQKFLQLTLYNSLKAFKSFTFGKSFWDSVAWFSFPLELLKIHKKHAPPGNPAPRGNPGLKRTREGAIFKKFFLKTIFKSNINLIQKVLNFVTIQRNNLQASPIS
jgi:hypothetical protein